jgi:ADP-ribose pyrophosphatase
MGNGRRLSGMGEAGPIPRNDTLRWKVRGQRPIYRSDWVSLWHATVELPDGSVIEDHHVVDYPRPAVGVVPIASDGRVLLVDHDRFITGERTWEIPSGGVDDGEDRETAARREAMEEGGVACAELVFLGDYRPSIGSSNQLFVLYLASGVEQTAPISDTNEIIAARWFEVARVREMIDRNEIPDGLSLTALLWAFYKGYLKQAEPSEHQKAG